ncbi:MAG: hypothetical protein KY447_05140 [Actinobacteria bacterium]|nr:hypothetical protein [Actinomycetota bacterium]
MADLTYAFAAGGVRQWPRVWARHIADHGPGRIVVHVAERKSLYDHDCRVFVVDADSSIVDRGVVDQLRQRGTAVVAVWDPAQPRTKELGVRLGADGLIEADAKPEELVRLAVELAGMDRFAVEQAGVERLAPEAKPTRVETAPARVDVAPPQQPRRAGGLRLAVAGPVGDEALEITVELARALAHAGKAVVAVDVDEIHPGLAQRLGVPVLPNLRIAVDALRDRHRPLSDSLLGVPAGGFWILAGLADPAQWAEVHPSEVAEVIAGLADDCDVVVAHTGPIAEGPCGHGAPDRFGISRRALADADHIIGVAVATPTGLARLTAWVADVRLVAPATPLHVALARAPGDAFGRAELTDSLWGDLHPASVSLIPADARVEAAAWAGGFARRGPFTEGVSALAAAVMPSPAVPERSSPRRFLKSRSAGSG